MTVRHESKAVDASPLGKPLSFPFSGRSAPNRFLKAAMTERLSSWDGPEEIESRGIPSKNLIEVYRRWGEGGFGQILTGNIMIHPEHLEARGNPIIPFGAPFDGPRFEAFRDLASASKKEGSLIVGQVSHPGRQVSKDIQPNPISASDVQLEGNVMGMEFGKPKPADSSDIKRVIDGFTHAAIYLEKAGYDGIELHAAHGYLLAQFLANSTNRRSDNYGGSLENRMRLILEIADSIRAATSPSFILGIKINSVEFQDGGFSPEDATAMCKALEDHKFDWVELSGGTYESLAFVHKRDSTRKREGFFLEFAEEIVKPLTKTRTYITGGFKSAGAMVDALQTVDGVGLARLAADEPDIPNKILKDEVHAGRKMQIDENNFGLANVAAGTQIRQLGKNQEPVDLSVQENVESFQKDMDTWSKKLQSDKAQKEYGYIDLEQRYVS